MSENQEGIVVMKPTIKVFTNYPNFLDLVFLP